VSSPDPRFVCHVGAHVTGARQLQLYLRENADRLASQGLHCVPRQLMQRVVGWGPKLVADPDRFAEELRSAARSPGIDGVLASHEDTIGRPLAGVGGGLYAGAAPTLQALAEVSRPFRCTVVLAVRPQADFLESYYLQTVRAGEWRTFDDWLGELDLDDISWLPLHERLVEAFGVDAVRVLDFAAVEPDPVAQVRTFLRLIDVDVPIDLEVSRVDNPRTSEKALSMALAANPYVRSADERLGLRTFLRKHFSGRDYPLATLLTDEQRSALNQRYGDEYRRLVGTQPVGGARP
jgi:hypothetical protein